jgi:hypothetical protein
MEKKIFDEIVNRLNDPTVITYLGTGAVKTIAWFEDQVEQSMAKEVENHPFECPAVFIEFANTVYDNTVRNRQHGKGRVTLHIVQRRIGQDGKSSSTTFSTFDATIGYKDNFINLFDGFKLPCAALLTLTDTEVDHKNRPLRNDKVTFGWKYSRKKPSGLPGF